MNPEELKQYRATVNKINEMLSRDNELMRFLSRNSIADINNAFKLVSEQIEKVIAGQTDIEVSNQEKVLVYKTVNYFLDVAAEKADTPPLFRDLAGSYLLLVMNWNESLGNMLSVRRDIRIIDGLIKMKLNLEDTIYVLRYFLDRIRTLRQFEPPAFNLSMAYLENLKKHIGETKAGGPEPEKEGDKPRK